MLNAIIRFSLRQKLLVVAACVFLLGFGAWRMYQLPIDVFPDLNRPRVVVMTEAPGLAPEEVETLITFPLETSLNGASGVQAVRSSSGVGISVIYVEFDWGTDIYVDRQIVNERLALASEQLPKGIRPQLAPISSIMGQIMVVGVFSEQTEKTRLFSIPADFAEELNAGDISQRLIQAFASHDHLLSEKLRLEQDRPNTRWFLVDESAKDSFAIIRRNNILEVHRGSSPLGLRTQADWVVRQRLLTIPGVSQVFVMGGGRKQFQVLVDPKLLIKYGVSLHEVKEAVQESNQNTTGGYLDDQGPNEYLVRVLGRIQSTEELEQVVVKYRDRAPVYLKQVATVVAGPQVKRGDSAAFLRESDGDFSGGSSVALTINKQPGADTRRVSDEIVEALKQLDESLPDDIRIVPELYQQRSFIDLAIDNVIEALRDGGILVVIILILFLLNFRTTFITLTAIPLSIVTTALVFAGFGLSINTMTLGGLAVAIGELVDDAIVDVENIYRRLKENKLAGNPKSPLLVVFQASVEVRNSIVFGTIIVVLVFVPLFFLTGMEGRLFVPLGVAYIVSITSSLAVSLTLTPVLSYWLLSKNNIWPWVAALMAPLASLAITYFILPLSLELMWLEGWAHTMDGFSMWTHLAFCAFLAPVLWIGVMLADWLLGKVEEGLLLNWLKSAAGWLIRFSIAGAIPVLMVMVICVAISGVLLYNLERDFLPPFNEGAVQVNVLLPPGTSLKKSEDVNRIVERRLQEIPEVEAFVRRTGRAELDEHAEGVNTSEYIAALDQHSERSREAILDDIRETLQDVPGIVISVEQPLAHLISHMLSGVKAQVAIKLYGDDLDVLRQQGESMKNAIAGVEGVKDLQVEQQVIIPQLRIEIDGGQLHTYGLTRNDINELVETAMNGEIVSQVLDGQRTFDLLVRLEESQREDLDAIRRLSIDLPNGGTTTLDSVARIYEAGGPNTINRERVRRRIVVQCNTSGRGLVDVVSEIKRKIEPIEKELPEGYFTEYGGQFESQQSASQSIGIMFGVSMIGMFLVLYTMFRSANLSLQVMMALPMAFIGSVAALYLTNQTLTIASMVGFISLCGIASRNGILLINHYLHLVKYEGEDWTPEMIVRAGQERLAPVLMTALTSGIGLIPLALAAGEPGKEILYPVATVIIGGLISSTCLEFLVRPALFWTFGMSSAADVVSASKTEVKLVEEHDEDF